MQHELNLTIWSINTDRADEVRSIIIECHYIGVIADKRVSQVACGAESLKFASTTEPSNVEGVIARQVEAQASSRSSRPAGSSATSKQTPTSLDPPPSCLATPCRLRLASQLTQAGSSRWLGLAIDLTSNRTKWAWNLAILDDPLRLFPSSSPRQFSKHRPSPLDHQKETKKLVSSCLALGISRAYPSRYCCRRKEGNGFAERRHGIGRLMG